MTDMAIELIRQLASLTGVEAEYHDIWGNRIQVEPETLAGVLWAMGHRDLSEEALHHEIQAIRTSRDFPVPPVISTKTGEIHFTPCSQWRSGSITVRGEAGEETRFNWRGEDELVFRLPSEFPRGYYRVTGSVEGSSGEAPVSALLVHAPVRCTPPADPAGWGTTLSLYSLDSGRHRGIGDLEDLRDTLEILERNGAGFVGLLPLHLLENRSPFGISPYYPLDRMLWNPIYLNLDQVARYHEWTDPFFGTDGWPTIQGESPSGLVDYERVWKEKRDCLSRVFDRFYQMERQPATPRWETFQTYLNVEGERGWMTAFFSAFHERTRKPWRDWSSSFRNRDQAAIREWIKGNERSVLFQGWLQWMMELFLRDMVKDNNLLGFDLPIGSSPDGSECWLEQELFASGASVGAPPDDFSPQGQNWGFLPVNPQASRQEEYRHFRALLLKNMRFCRYLRIDHIMGLYRSFWIPETAGAGQGTYVRNYPEDLFAILALESERNEVTVIGEDLGTVPPRVRELMDETGVLSTRVFYFERDQQGLPPAPDYYPSQAFITLNTHDMPTLKGYTTGFDLDLRRELGIFDQETFERLRQEREDFLQRALDRLRDWGYLTGSVNGSGLHQVLFPALVRYLAATPCQIRVMSLEDILGLNLQPNLPSTTIPPNWRHRVDVGNPAFEEQVKKVQEIFQDASS